MLSTTQIQRDLYRSIYTYKQQLIRSDVSTSWINVVLSKREVGSWGDVYFAFNTI